MLTGTPVGTGPAGSQLSDGGQLQRVVPGGVTPGGGHQAHQRIIRQHPQPVGPGPVGGRGQRRARRHLIQHPTRGEPAAVPAIAMGEPGIHHLGHHWARPGAQTLLGGQGQPFLRRVDVEVEVTGVKIGRAEPAVDRGQGGQLRRGQLAAGVQAKGRVKIEAAGVADVDHRLLVIAVSGIRRHLRLLSRDRPGFRP
jgi:hypothetical protein